MRFEAPLSSDDETRTARALEALGVRVRFAAPAFGRQYALVEGRNDVEPAEVPALDGSVVHDDALIVLAIEPWTVDALSPLQRALASPGSLAGIKNCERAGDALLVEFNPAVTSASMVLQIVDAELRRFGAPVRRTSLLAPLPVATATQIAAEGLNCAELTPARVLELLVEQSLH
jgi:hypothetical protein